MLMNDTLKVRTPLRESGGPARCSNRSAALPAWRRWEQTRRFSGRGGLKFGGRFPSTRHAFKPAGAAVPKDSIALRHYGGSEDEIGKPS